MENISKLKSGTIHLEAAKALEFPYAYDPSKDFKTQREAIEEKFKELLRVPEKITDPVPIIEYKKTDDPDFDEIRFSFESEPGLFVPAHMLLPKNISGKLPLAFCLQGHSTGMHVSLGRRIYERDKSSIEVLECDYAIQAVKRGYIAIAMEQRGFGEMKSDLAPNMGCQHVAMQALMLGRTLIGERTLDITQLINAISDPNADADFKYIDLDRIGLLGCSGGGTATYHGACIEKRVKAVIPVCSFNTYCDSIIAMNHCTCNYIPDIMKYMDMPDLAVMLAPRPLIIVHGKDDPIFPVSAVYEGFEKVKMIYKAAGAPDNCELAVGNGVHKFYPEEVWAGFSKFV